MNLTDPIFSMASTPRWTVASKNALRWIGISLIVIVWLSALLFSFYILAYYLPAVLKRKMDAWNEVLPGLYTIMPTLGSIQLVKSIRHRFPLAHRWIGRIYIISALLAAVGCLVFITLKGTVGGLVMDIGFSIYGILLFISAIETYRYAVKGRITDHQVWGLRLYALVTGSWLYRMYYGCWLALTDGAGHTATFNGTFDHVIAFSFYLPNLLVAEAFIRAWQFNMHPALRLSACLPLVVSAVFLLLATYYFAVHYWGAAIPDSMLAK